MEGVMMRNGDQYAVAVRKPDREIEVKISEYKVPGLFKKLRKLPIFRGIFGFIDSLYLGMSALMFSASFFEEEETNKKAAEGESKNEKLEMGGIVVFSILMALGIFFVLPYFLSTIFQRFISSEMLIALIEGLIRFAIFIGYIIAISYMEDIQRVFMYHGAEHKCINCIEHGMELTVENVRKSSRLHKRCGTSFLLIVMIISILFFMFIRVDEKWLRLVLRLILIPLIAGVSYEFIRLAGRYDNGFVNLLSKPGLWMQGLTTKEPDDEMIQVGMASVEAVFDWRTWQKEAE